MPLCCPLEGRPLEGIYQSNVEFGVFEIFDTAQCINPGHICLSVNTCFFDQR